jgi:RNA-directed DNA polymerase
VLKTAFCFIRSATTGFTVSAFPYPSRVSLKEAFAVLELCAGKLACTVLRGPGPSNGVWLLGATKASRWGKVRALQRLLTHSYSGKVLAVRRVTENQGKKTPGVDQEIWDTPEKKTQAVHAFKRRGYQPQPLRRVYILKSDKKTMRPLGIPTMKDRSHQALHLLALDPVLETTADKNSYGFRQQRSCADAIEQCFKTLARPNPQWILASVYEIAPTISAVI